MALTNSCRFLGRITKHIESSTINNGKTMAKVSIAVQRDYKNAMGEYDSDFVPLVAFGATADYLLKYAEKGDEIFVETNFRQRSYENAEGKKVFMTEFIIENSKILRKANKPTNETPTEKQPTANIVEQVPLIDKYPNGIIQADDDLPF